MSEQLSAKQERDADHLWLVWINKRQDERRKAREEHEHSLYEFKSILQFLSACPQRALRAAFEGRLSSSHQQCSHQLPVPILTNTLRCCLGEDVTQCDILLSLREVVTSGLASQSSVDGALLYDLPDEALYRLMAKTCAWHIYQAATGVVEGLHGVDTLDGHLMDESDRMFWSRVYENLSEPDNDELNRTSSPAKSD